MIKERSTPAERLAGPVSKVVGLYQTFLRRVLEHFFPDGVLDAVGDRSVIDWDGTPDEDHYRIADDPDGVGLVIEWLRTRYLFQPGSPTPFLPSERRLLETVV